MESEWIQIRLFLLHIPHFPIQASDDTPQEDTFERKISRLQKIRGARPKTIIAKTGHETTGRYGIKLIDLARWLMGTGPQGRRMAPQRRSLGACEA